MASTVPLGDVEAFHSVANISQGCLQVRSLFWPINCRTFISDYFERRHLVVRQSVAAALTARASGFGDDMLRASDLAQMASFWQFKIGVDHSQARVILPNSFAHDSTWVEGTVLDGASLRRAVRSNRTVVMHNVELYWRPITMLSLALMRTFGVYAQANVYYSPAGMAAAVHAHQDAQSVFILQVEGRKRWQLFAPPQRWRLRNNQRGKAGDTAPTSELTDLLADVELNPTDTLFVPRGVYHRTSTLSTLPLDGPEPDSLHITVGIETDTDEWTWLSLLKDAAATLAIDHGKENLERGQWVDERLREALPLALCRPFGNMDVIPGGYTWLRRARDLLREHTNVRLDLTRLRRALDAALKTRQDLVERKRQQILQFMQLTPETRSGPS
jgi:oxalate decarboxylase/phosphoglucose isomerase-like protein (cupin superfamily)